MEHFLEEYRGMCHPPEVVGQSTRYSLLGLGVLSWRDLQWIPKTRAVEIYIYFGTFLDDA